MNEDKLLLEPFENLLHNNSKVSLNSLRFYPEKHILSLVENHPFLSTTSSEYLVIDNFNGTIICDIRGQIKYLYLLELKRASLVVFIDDKQLYGEILGIFLSKQVLDGLNKYLSYFIYQKLHILLQTTKDGTFTEKISVCTSTAVIALNFCTLFTYPPQDKDECGYI